MAATRTTRKAPADRRPKSVRPVVVAKEPRSLVEIVTADTDAEDEGIPVFSIDGEVYSMPSSVSAAIALEVLDRMRHEGEMAATAWMLEQVLGNEAFVALKSCKSLSSDHLASIMDHVNDHVMGALEGSTGN